MIVIRKEGRKDGRRIKPGEPTDRGFEVALLWLTGGYLTDGQCHLTGGAALLSARWSTGITSRWRDTCVSY